MNQTINTSLQIWLTWIFTKAIGICGAGLAAIGITTSHNTPELMAGVSLTALQMVLSWWNTRRALNAVPPTPPVVSTWPLHAGCAAAGLAAMSLCLSACGTSGSASATSAASTPTASTASSIIEESLPVVGWEPP